MSQIKHISPFTYQHQLPPEYRIHPTFPVGGWSDGEGPHPLIIEDRRICSVWEILDFQCHGLKYLVDRDFIPHYSLYFMILIQINLHLVERVGRHNIKVPGPMERAVKGTVQHKWLPTAPGVCSQCVCFHCCVHLGWVKCWALIPSMGHHTWSYVTSLFHYKRTPHTQLSFGPHIELWTAYLFSVYIMTLSLRFVRVYCVPSLLSVCSVFLIGSLPLWLLYLTWIPTCLPEVCALQSHLQEQWERLHFMCDILLNSSSISSILL